MLRQCNSDPVDTSVGQCGHTSEAPVQCSTQQEGRWQRCYHKCRSIFTWQFFVGLTLSFPIEHALWTKVPGFYHIAHWLGLSIGH